MPWLQNHGLRTKKYYFAYSRNGTVGEKLYSKLNPKWGRKVPMKQIDCMCCLVVRDQLCTFEIHVKS